MNLTARCSVYKFAYYSFIIANSRFKTEVEITSKPRFPSFELTISGSNAIINIHHPLYVIKRGWITAGDLVEGVEILTLDGIVAYVTGSELEQLSETIKVVHCFTTV